MPNHLWPLLRLKANTEAELKEQYRKIYLETYVRDAEGKGIELYDWHGRRIRFHARSFDHAFSESSDYRYGDGFHDLYGLILRNSEDLPSTFYVNAPRVYEK